jgi:hypothetical protein
MSTTRTLMSAIGMGLVLASAFVALVYMTSGIPTPPTVLIGSAAGLALVFTAAATR